LPEHILTEQFMKRVVYVLGDACYISHSGPVQVVQHVPGSTSLFVPEQNSNQPIRFEGQVYSLGLQTGLELPHLSFL